MGYTVTMKFLVAILVCALISVYEVSCRGDGKISRKYDDENTNNGREYADSDEDIYLNFQGNIPADEKYATGHNTNTEHEASAPKRKRKLEVDDELDVMQKPVKKKKRLNRTAICSGLDTSDRSLCSANYVNPDCPPGATCTIKCSSDALAVGPAAQKIENSILLKCNGETGTFKLEDNTCYPIERCGICLVPLSLSEMKQADPDAYNELRKEEQNSTGIFPWEEYELVAPYKCHSMHFFHRSCIKDWLKTPDEKCPECRAVIKEWRCYVCQAHNYGEECENKECRKMNYSRLESLVDSRRALDDALRDLFKPFYPDFDPYTFQIDGTLPEALEIGNRSKILEVHMHDFEATAILIFHEVWENHGPFPLNGGYQADVNVVLRYIECMNRSLI